MNVFNRDNPMAQALITACWRQELRLSRAESHGERGSLAAGAREHATALHGTRTDRQDKGSGGEKPGDATLRHQWWEGKRDLDVAA